MTKKSMARLEKDKVKKELIAGANTNKAWDELKKLHDSMLLEIIKISATIKDLYSTPELHRFLKSPQNTSNIIKCLAADIASTKSRIDGIYSLHANKDGGWKTEEEYFSTLPIYEEYVSVQNEISGTILPSISILFEDYEFAVTAANNKIQEDEDAKKANSEEALLDPTVISDAVMKENDGN